MMNKDRLVNVAITCDSLLERNHANEIVELLCEAFPESMIYTLAHKEKAILGTIEQRKIKSTGLSRKVHIENDLHDHLLVLPHLTKAMSLSCQHDYVLNVSRGFSHAFTRCEKSKQITYLYELSFEEHFNTFWKKLLRPYITNKFINALKNINKVLVSNEKLKNDLLKFGIESEVLLPPFRLSDYALFPKSMFKHDFFTVDTRGLTVDEMIALVDFFEKRNERFQFVGPIDGLGEKFESLKKSSPENRFFGERCSGEHAPVLASSRAFISFDNVKFPKMTLAALAVGRPVVMKKIHADFASGEGTYFVSQFDLKELGAALDRINREHSDLDHQKVRANVMKYHDIKFKAQLKRILDREMGLGSEVTSSSQELSTPL